MNTMASDKPTILLVDDQHSIRQIVGAGLKAHGFDVVTAASGENALAVCEGFDRRIDLLISDLSLTPQEFRSDTTTDAGGPHGVAVAQRALELRPSLKIILITGHSDQYLTRLGLKTDGFLLLRKPFHLPMLVEMCRQLVQEASQALPSPVL